MRKRTTTAAVPRPRWTQSSTKRPCIHTAIDAHGHVWAWLGMPLGGESMLGERGWLAEYRLAIQQGRLVVAEVRVRPARWAFDETGQSGEAAGLDAADVPLGGVSTRLLRTLSVGAPVDHMAELLQLLDRAGVLPDVLADAFPHPETLRSRRAQAAAGRPAGPSRGGRQPLSDAVLLEAAEAYLAARKRGSPRPVPEAAARAAMSEARMRDLIYRARRRGLLTATRQGRGGGSFTPKALALRKSRARPQRKTTSPAIRRYRARPAKKRRPRR
jgi:hypothetical protein